MLQCELPERVISDASLPSKDTMVQSFAGKAPVWVEDQRKENIRKKIAQIAVSDVRKVRGCLSHASDPHRRGCYE